MKRLDLAVTSAHCVGEYEADFCVDTFETCCQIIVLDAGNFILQRFLEFPQSTLKGERLVVDPLNRTAEAVSVALVVGVLLIYLERTQIILSAVALPMVWSGFVGRVF